MKHRELRDAAFARFSERGAYPVAHVGEDLPLEKSAFAKGSFLKFVDPISPPNPIQPQTV